MIFVVLAVFLVLFVDDAIGERQLRFVHAVWRHGDRAPASTFPTDTGNLEYTWPQGFGELTSKGVRQQYQLGEFLKQRYEKLLSPKYDSREIYIRSTSYNRTIMSALANLAGMYPPVDKEIWLKNITWQPIPVHNQPKETDPLLWMDRPCPTASDIYYNHVLKSDAVKKVEAENREFLNFLKMKSGMSKMDLPDVWNIMDPLNCEKAHVNDGHSWPSWVNESVFQKVMHLYDVGSTFYYSTPELQRFRGGMLFAQIADRMNQKAKNDTKNLDPRLKFYAYSAHDTTLIALLANLDLYDGASPTYASAVLFELFEETDGTFVVEIYKRNTTKDEVGQMFRLNLTDCQPCTVDKFLSKANTRRPNNWYKECGLSNDGSDPHDNLKLAVGILAAAAAVMSILFIFVLVLYLRLRKNGSHGSRLLVEG